MGPVVSVKEVDLHRQEVNECQDKEEDGDDDQDNEWENDSWPEGWVREKVGDTLERVEHMVPDCHL